MSFFLYVQYTTPVKAAKVDQMSASSFSNFSPLYNLEINQIVTSNIVYNYLLGFHRSLSLVIHILRTSSQILDLRRGLSATQ